MTNVSDWFYPNRVGWETQGRWRETSVDRVDSWGVSFMGKGDRRSKRGKIFRGTFGKRRPRPEKVRKQAKEASAQPQS